MVKGRIDLSAYNGNNLTMLERNDAGKIIEHSKVELKNEEPVIILYQVENDIYTSGKGYVVMSEESGESLTIGSELVNINNEDELIDIPILKF